MLVRVGEDRTHLALQVAIGEDRAIDPRDGPARRRDGRGERRRSCLRGESAGEEGADDRLSFHNFGETEERGGSCPPLSLRVLRSGSGQDIADARGRDVHDRVHFVGLAAMAVAAELCSRVADGGATVGRSVGAPDKERRVPVGRHATDLARPDDFTVLVMAGGARNGRNGCPAGGRIGNRRNGEAIVGVGEHAASRTGHLDAAGRGDRAVPVYWPPQPIVAVLPTGWSLL